MLSPVFAWHRCRLGWIEAGWTVEDRRVAYDFTKPEGAEGVLDLPARYRNVAVDGAALSPDAGAPSVPRHARPHVRSRGQGTAEAAA